MSYYQHKARRPDNFYIEQHRQQIPFGAFSGAAGLGRKFVTTSQRYYFFILQPRRNGIVAACMKQMRTTP
ncbi:hypothetical protein [Dysosmobacter sp.]|uniref:hypothetical protein n=1 Tax=Dysosmobacter sp. TaxID=2591382 RepID=UPI002DBD94FB|nr:hypothetical protein [Dysosmobacter sp.]